MSPAAILKVVKNRYPELKALSKTKLRLVEEALVFASEVASSQELLSDVGHEQLMKHLSPEGSSPASSLKAYRLRQGLTQQELSKKSGISQANISAMEKGRRPIGLGVAKKLAAILGCDYRRLV